MTGAENLTSQEKQVLLVLMAESRAMTTAELDELGPGLPDESQNTLTKLSLIETDSETFPATHTLTDTGWAVAGRLIGSPPSPDATPEERAFHTVLAGMRRWLDREDIRPHEVFAPQPDARTGTSEPSTQAQEQRTTRLSALAHPTSVRDMLNSARKSPTSAAPTGPSVPASVERDYGHGL